MSQPLKQLEAALGHSFADPDLLHLALTHPSVERPARRHGGDYDRLEFLGDRVLGLVVADLLFRRYSEAPAGELARRYNALVRRESLARVAETLGIGAALKLSKAERATGGAAKPAILANACEAVIAALYLDGGLEVARAFITTQWEALVAAPSGVAKDAKTLLQEWAQARGMAAPHYRLVAQEGPPHEPLFTVAATLKGLDEAIGQGHSKREAEQAAASAALKFVPGGADDSPAGKAESRK